MKITNNIRDFANFLLKNMGIAILISLLVLLRGKGFLVKRIYFVKIYNHRQPFL